MVRFCLEEGTSGSKRKKCGNEEEEDLRKRACGRGEEETSEPEEEEESNEVGDEVEDGQEVQETAKDGGFLGEFKFGIDLDVLECSICFEPLSPPIFQCRNGHIACSHCCPNLLNKCHVCSQPIGRQRCIALEKVVESIKSPCQYAHFGCRAVLSFAGKAAHEERCSHAALFCPISSCTFSGSKSLLFAHAKRKHDNISRNFSYNLSFMIGLEKHQPFMVLLGEDGHLFLLLNSHETCPGNMLSVICMASSSPEYEFSYELRADTGGSLLRLRTSAEKVRKWNGVHPSKAFLVVPNSFFASSSQLFIYVCIYNKSIGSLT